MSQVIELSIIGGGWRSEFFLRVAQALPQQFAVTGMAVRNAQRREQLSAAYGVRCFDTVDELLNQAPGRFTVVCVPRTATPDIMVQAANADVPVLCETPPADGLEALRDVWQRLGDKRVQVAEQYPFQPHHAARLALIEQGYIGEPQYTQVSVAHGYHAMLLARRALNVGLSLPTVTGIKLPHNIVKGPNRQGPPASEILAQTIQDMVLYDFAGKQALYDFCGDQYMSYIWKRRWIIRGTRGEIDTDRMVYLKDYATPITTHLARDHAGCDGDLQGSHLNGITVGEQWVYRNPLQSARLSDDEIAVGTCLLRMNDYVQSGTTFYGLAEACHDAYLELLAAEAIKAGQAVTAVHQPWME
jgi:hypothetical protein